LELFSAVPFWFAGEGRRLRLARLEASRELDVSYAVSLYGLGAAVAPSVASRGQRGSFTIRVMHPSRTPVQRRPIVVVFKKDGQIIERNPLPATGGRVVFSMPATSGTYQYDVVETTTGKVLLDGTVHFYESHLSQNKEKSVYLPSAIAYTRADRKRRRKARRERRRSRRASRRARRRGTSGLGGIEDMSTIEKVGLVALLGFGIWSTFSR
jgi:hypothetical protein